jgi:hypothetical protein
MTFRPVATSLGYDGTGARIAALIGNRKEKLRAMRRAG